MQREQLHPSIELAGFWTRMGALFIDVLVLVAISAAITIVWDAASGVGVMGAGAEQLELTGGDFWTLRTGIQSLVIFLIFVAYVILFWRWKGQTPGKMALRLKIIRADGSDLGWSDVILRFLSYIISSLIFLIGFIWAFFDDYNQGIHDKLANTFVIRMARK